MAAAHSICHSTTPMSSNRSSSFRRSNSSKSRSRTRVAAAPSAVALAANSRRRGEGGATGGSLGNKVKTDSDSVDDNNGQ